VAEKQILILGGYGETGRRLTRRLLNRIPSRVIIAGRNARKAAMFASELNQQFQNERAKGIELDANNFTDVRRNLENVNLFIQAGPAFPVKTIKGLIQAVLDTGVDWIDIQLASSQAALKPFNERMKEEKRCCITQCGFHPGVPAAMVRWAAKELHTLYSAQASSFLNPENGLALTSGVDELIVLFNNYKAHIYENGKWQKVNITSANSFKKIKFAFGFGAHTTSPMDLEEMKPLPEIFPELRKTGFYIGGFNPITNNITTPLIMAGIKLLPWIKPETWGKLYCRSIKAFRKPPYGNILQVDAEGVLDGKSVKLQLALKHKDEYELTAIPIISMIEQLFDGSVRKYGLHRMALFIDPERMLKDIQEMGVDVHIERKNV